jgi:hypothetical protein
MAMTMARPGYEIRFQPDNPSVVNDPCVQGAQSYLNANDFNPIVKNAAYDRVPIQQCFLPTIDVRNNRYQPMDANRNVYNPRRYPDPMTVQTAYPARRLRKAPMNGSVTAYNPPNPRGMPSSGTNNVAFIVTTGL